MKNFLLKFFILTMILCLWVSILPTSASSDTPEEPVTDLKTYANTDEISVMSSMGEEFSDNAVIEVKKIDDSAKIEEIKTLLDKQISKITVYEITATEDDVAVQPEGMLLISFVLPEEYDIGRTSITYITEEGTPETVPTRQRGDSSVGVTIDRIGTFVLVEETIPEDKSDIGWIIAGVAVILLAGCGLTWYFLSRKKQDGKN